MKKLIATILILVIIVITFAFGWDYLRGLLAPAPPSEPPDGPPSGIQETGLKILSAKPVFDYWINKTSKEIYYLDDFGKIVKIGVDGKETTVASENINNLALVRPARDGKLALIAFSLRTNLKFAIFNAEDGGWQALPEGTTAAVWDPAKNRLAYLQKSGTQYALNILNLADNKTVVLAKLSQAGLDLAWFMPDEIYLIERPSAKIRSSIWSLNVSKKTIKTLFKEEPGLMISWSKDGKTALKFTNSFKENQLALVTSNNQLLYPSIIRPTLPSKCVVDDSIYCGVPQSLPAGIVLPDDYLMKKFYFVDDLVAWNAASGTAQIIFSGQKTPVDAERLTKFENTLFFINRYDGKLYSIGLGE